MLRENQASAPNKDMQQLLLNVQVHVPSLELLKLTFNHAMVDPEDLDTRAVLRSVYRLLKALVVLFPPGQSELSPRIPLFLEHSEAQLVAHDISPMGCVNAIFKDNYLACSSISLDTMRKAVKLAAQYHAPRFLRFLATLISPSGIKIQPNQTVILQCLVEESGAHVGQSVRQSVSHSQLAIRSMSLEDDHHSQQAIYPSIQPASLFYLCSISALPLLYVCSTCALLLLYLCSTSALPLPYLCSTFALPLLYLL